MKNPWELLASDELVTQMRLAGCERKYTDGNASDFEKFTALCSVFHRMRDNDAAEIFLAGLKDICHRQLVFEHIREENARALWLCARANYSDEKLNCDFDKLSKEHCVEKEKVIDNFTDVNLLVEGLKKSEFNSLSEICRHLENLGDLPIRITLEGSEFMRPSRYAAEQIFKKIANGEKYNISEYNLLLSQIICEIIFTKSDGILQLILQCDNDLQAAKNLINYLSLRKLSARIFLSVSVSSSVDEIKNVCLLSNEFCFITPIFSKKEIDTESRATAFLQSLSRVYPIGSVSFLQ